MSLEKVNVAEQLSLFDEHWSPKIVGVVWHHHGDEDELFWS